MCREQIWTAYRIVILNFNDPFDLFCLIQCISLRCSKVFHHHSVSLSCNITELPLMHWQHLRHLKLVIRVVEAEHIWIKWSSYFVCCIDTRIIRISCWNCSWYCSCILRSSCLICGRRYCSCIIVCRHVTIVTLSLYVWACKRIILELRILNRIMMHLIMVCRRFVPEKLLGAVWHGAISIFSSRYRPKNLESLIDSFLDKFFALFNLLQCIKIPLLTL